MVMLLGRNWKIESNELNVTLYELQKSKKTGHEYWRPHSYYSSIANALKGLVNININRSGLTDLETINQRIEELYRIIGEINPALTPLPSTRNATACKEAHKTSNKGRSMSQAKQGSIGE